MIEVVPAAATPSRTRKEEEGSRLLPSNSAATVADHAAYLNVQVDVSSTSTRQRDEQIAYIIGQLCPFLGGRSDDHHQRQDSNSSLIIRPLTGGLSNHLFIVSSTATARTSSFPPQRLQEPNCVLVRIHPEAGSDIVNGNNTDDNNILDDDTSFSVVDRSIENKVAVWLAQQGLAPKVYGRFKNGRVEEFYQNVEPISCPLMKRYIPQIASSMADFHSLQAPPDVLPRPKSSLLPSDPRQSLRTIATTSPPLSSSIFVTVDEWLEAARELFDNKNRSLTSTSSPSILLNKNKEGMVDETDADVDVDVDGDTLCGQSTASSNSASTNQLGPEASEDDDDNENNCCNDAGRRRNDDDDVDCTPENRSDIELLNEVEREWTWLSDQLSTPPRSTNPMTFLACMFIRQVVVTHMDCQPLNILVSKLPAAETEDWHDRKIRLIDFEYAGWNPRASDIGNTFCEFCEMSNLRANYEDEYPSAQQQDEYFRHYCKRTVGANATAADPTRSTDPSRPQSALDEFVSSVLNDSRNGRSMTIPIDRETLQLFIETLQCPDNHPSSWGMISSALSGEVGRFSLISHLSWCVWSLLKSQEEDGVLDFDYIVYARHRMDGYLWAKKKFFA